MHYNDFQKMVIGKIKSDSLKNAIKKQNTVFSFIEIMKIICEYVEEYADRIYLLKKMLSVLDDEKIYSYVNFVIDWMENSFQQLKQDSPDCIFELYIKYKSDSFNERYLCDSFNSAISLIDEYCEEYSYKSTEHIVYKIVKRKIHNSSNDAFDEDYMGSCTLNFHKKICSVFFYQEARYYECDGMCCKCDRLCMTNVEIQFPAFIGYQDLVRYQDFEGRIKYGISFDDGSFQCEVCYIIPLDCEALLYNYFEKAHDFHKHISYPYVEKISESELPEKYKRIYKEYFKYLEK